MEQSISNQSLSSIIDYSLNSTNKETREKFSEIVKDPLFTPIYDISIRNQKELAQKRLKKIADCKLVSVRDFKKDPENIFTMHELVRNYFYKKIKYIFYPLKNIFPTTQTISSPKKFNF